MSRILCVEDSLEVQMILKRALGEKHEVSLASTIGEARTLIGKNRFDLVILDIGLPDGDGLRYCSELKSHDLNSEIPIFILSGISTLQEKMLGFQLGVEDYVVKPFDAIELRARVESRLKKIAIQKQQKDIYTIGCLKIDYSSQRTFLRLKTGDRAAELSSTEFKILSFLARSPDQIKSRETIISAVWTEGFHLSDRTIDSHISRIRKKLKGGDFLIEAVAGAGYRFSLMRKSKFAA
jgi:DNA-binding response OmpR family regulator